MSRKQKFKPAVAVANRADDPYITSGAGSVQSDKFWRWGDDNLFPNALALMARRSVTHRRIINDKADYISGKGFSCDEGHEPLLAAFIRRVNGDGESLRQVLNKLAGGVGQISVERTSRLFRAEVFGWLPLPETLKQMFFDYGFMVYAAIIIAILVQIFLKRTNRGLNLRSVGESPATADAAGINVTRYKYLATCIGGGITGLGGVYYVMDYIKGTWANDGTIENLGWLAVALVIFATWKPTRAIWGSYLFGIFFWAYLLIASGLTRRSQELFRMLPYIVTIIVLIIVSLRRKKEDQPPAALGLSYFREER